MNSCDQFAKHGTGYGSCGGSLDQYGQCIQSGDHADENSVPRQPIKSWLDMWRETR